MANFQERFIHRLIQSSIGGSLIFHPENYPKGNSMREPCDVVWASNNCIVLIWMTTKGENRPTARRKAEEHNLDQIGGWLDAWKSGEMLRGKSKLGVHRIGYSDYKHVICISILSGYHDHARILSEHKDRLVDKGLNCTICANLTEGVFQHLAKYGGSLIDLINYIFLLRDTKHELNSSEALELLQNYHNAQTYIGIEKSGASSSEVNQSLQSLSHLLRLMKIPSEETLVDMAEFFNDLSWSQIICISLSLNSALEEVEAVPLGAQGTRAKFLSFDLFPYLVFLFVAAMDNDFEARNTQVMNVENEAIKASPNYQAVSLFFGVTEFARLPMFAYKPSPTGFVSATEMLLG